MNEISVSGSLTVNNPGVTPGVRGFTQANPLLFNQTGTTWVEGTIQAQILATAVPLGNVVSPHWSYWINQDPTNYVTIQNGPTGAVLARLYPGEPAWIPLDLTCVPYVVANTAPVVVDYGIFAF